MTQTTAIPVLPLDQSSDRAIEERTVSKVLWRLIPFMCLLYLFNYLDRVNVQFAQLQMSVDLKFSDDVYGMGAGIFFVGYFLFEVPSNLILQKVGARLWMTRIMVTWGMVSSLMMFVHDEWTFYGLRLLLGIAEAGFFPGMILYMTWWIPAKQRGQAAALLLTATALSGVVGGPIAGLLLQINGLGLRGWQWMYLLEGVPSVLLGISILWVFDDRPEHAKWLSDEERSWLATRLAAERAAMPDTSSHRLIDAVRDGRMWVLALLYGTIMFGFYGINFWTALVVRNVTGYGEVAVGFLSAIPFIAAAVTMTLVGRWADRKEKRRLAVTLSAAAGAAGMALAAVTRHPAVVLIGLSLAAAGIWSTLGPFWSLPSRFLAGTAAAAGIGAINSIGNLFGGQVSPKVMGHLKVKYGTYDWGLWVISGVLLVAVIVSALLSRLGVRDRDSHPTATPINPNPEPA